MVLLTPKYQRRLHESKAHWLYYGCINAQWYRREQQRDNDMARSTTAINARERN